jgi:tetratricopeptide (TPR) repeat protein
MLILLHGGQSAGQLKEWEDSLKWLAELTTKHPQSPYLNEAQYEQGWANQNLKKYDEAAKLYTEASANRGEVGARARFMLGEVLFTQKQHEAAIKEFLRVMFGYGGEAAPAEIKKWQAKAGYEAGRCSEVQIKDEKNAAKKQQFLADALKYYGYVVEKHPEAGEKPEAAKRVAELSKLKG